MALPKLPADTTSRYRLVYSVAGIVHRINVHVPTATAQADAVTLGTNLANLLKGVLPNNCIFSSIEWAQLGSNIFNPIASLNIAGTVAGSTSTMNTPGYLSFVGRSLSGRKTRLFLFGVQAVNDNNWRVEGPENTAVQAVITGLNSGTGSVACIDGTMPVWKGYANFGYHRHFVKKARQGAG